ncbi:MAG: DUF3500 domain-containing protein [Chloroflexota bacterium]
MHKKYHYLPLLFCTLIAIFAIGCSSSLPDFTELAANADDVVGDCVPTMPESGTAAATAAQALIDSVGSSNVQFALDASQRYTWSVLPVPLVERPDQGARMGDLDEAAKTLVCQLVDVTLSDSGVELVFGSMSSDELLGNSVNRADREYTKDNYWVSIFGDPSGGDVWAYQLEGHHLGINVAIKGDEMIAGPLLFGGYPLLDEDGTAFLGAQETLALAFAATLASDQLSQLVVSSEPSEVDVNSESANYVFIEPATSGLAGSALSAEQQTALVALIDSYVETMPAEQAAAVKELVAGELEQAIVSWEGCTNAKPFGYGVRLPSLHIFYSNEDEPQHAHIIFRLPNHDYGKALMNQ